MSYSRRSGVFLRSSKRETSVQLSAPNGAALPDLLTALKQCLDENAIAAVKVELDGQAYAMEGLT